ncbi:MAG: efflux RND transporter periplasmic adaptor subunit [Candidatus Omnitrophica bacterium]|nr:efflux RND transporter periplasmic adaptor subunit [Candidatus Omnitrophota bacterium]
MENDKPIDEQNKPETSGAADGKTSPDGMQAARENLKKGKYTQKKSGAKGKFSLPKFNMKGIAKNFKKNYIPIVVVLLIGSLILARSFEQIKNVMFGKTKEKTKQVEFAETIPVKVYKVKRMDFKDTLPIMGRIEGFKEVELKFETNGIIESFNFEEGERVLEGDIIASLDQRDALLKLKYATLEAEKAQKLHDLGGTDKLALEQKKLEYESAKRDLEKTNIYAKSDGYLGTKEKSIGSFVSQQDKVGTFVDYSSVYAVFDIIEEDVSKVQLGQKVDIFADAYPSETFSGTIDTISPIIEGHTRTQKVKVELKNEKSMLKPGMFIKGVLNTYEKKDAMIIPSSAFKKKEQQYFVYVVHEEKAESEKEASGETGTETGANGEGGEGEKAAGEVKKATGDKEAPADENAENAEPSKDEGSKDAVGAPEELKPGSEEKSADKNAKAKPAKPEKSAKPEKPAKADKTAKAGKDEKEASSAPGAQGEGQEAGKEESRVGIVEERPIEIEYLTHDMAEIGKGLEEGELVIRELHQEYKDKDKVEIAEVQETIF